MKRSQYTWTTLNETIPTCQKCPRLRQHCGKIAEVKRRAYFDWNYWGAPVPNFGDAEARLLIVGLAPGAHGANRTGRMFTGDRSGDWLYRALHKAGFASQAGSASRDDGLTLNDCAITAVCHCAPPDNKPTSDEVTNCGPWFREIWNLLPVKVVLALGQLAWRASVDEALRRNWIKGNRPKFRHGEYLEMSSDRYLVGCYHPSQQNTFTGRLTETMLDDVFRRVRNFIE